MLQLISSALNVLFPPTCRGCMQDGHWICHRCLAGLRSVDIYEPFPGVNRLLCLGRYNQPLVERCVRDLKYAGGQMVARDLGRALGLLLRERGIMAEAVIAVPLSSRRRRERGFNQAEAIARSVARTIGLPLISAVVRVRHTRSQVTLTEAARRLNVRGAFRSAASLAKVPRRGIIVDDVFTTGSTIGEVARVLRSRGMQSITAATVAKG